MRVIIIEKVCYGTFTDKTTGKRISYNRALTRTEDGGGVTYELQKITSECASEVDNSLIGCPVSIYYDRNGRICRADICD